MLSNSPQAIHSVAKPGEAWNSDNDDDRHDHHQQRIVSSMKMSWNKSTSFVAFVSIHRKTRMTGPPVSGKQQLLPTTITTTATATTTIAAATAETIGPANDSEWLQEIKPGFSWLWIVIIANHYIIVIVVNLIIIIVIIIIIIITWKAKKLLIWNPSNVVRMDHMFCIELNDKSIFHCLLLIRPFDHILSLSSSSLRILSSTALHLLEDLPHREDSILA